MKNEIAIVDLITLDEIELSSINGGSSFAYDVGWGIRYIASVFGGSGTRAAFEANEAAVEAIEAM